MKRLELYGLLLVIPTLFLSACTIDGRIFRLEDANLTAPIVDPGAPTSSYGGRRV